MKKPLPEFWQSHLQEKIDKIKKLKEQANGDCTSFIVVSDYHIICNQKNSVQMIETILNECDIPYFFNAGDVVSGVGICTEEYLIGEIKQCLEDFKPIESKGLYAEGNHDRAFSTFEPPHYYVENITKKQFDDIYFSTQKKYSDRVFGGYGYYYVDEQKSKTRFIVLNSHDVPNDDKTPEGFAKYNVMHNFGFLQDQINWFATVALDLPSEEWSVVVCSHAEYFGAKGTIHCYNYAVMYAILNAFKNGEKYKCVRQNEDPSYNLNIDVDFKNKKGNFIVWVSGHVHNDMIVSINGIVSVTTTTDGAYLEIHKEKAGTIKEQAFDVYIIDKKKRSASVIRIGDGKDREFTY